MRAKYAGWVAAVALGLWLGVGGVGCSKSTAPVDRAPVALKLPGATNVFTALAQKNYEGAIAEWAKLKDTATDDEQRAQFAALTTELRNRLSEAANTDPKAAEAFNALRTVLMGR